MMYGTVAVKSSTVKQDELLEVKCQAQQTIRETFINRRYDVVTEIQEATLLYFDQDEDLECSTSDNIQNEGSVPIQQLTNDEISMNKEASSGESFLSSAALVGLSFAGGILIAAVAVGLHYQRTQRTTRRNVSCTDDDLNLIIADV